MRYLISFVLIVSALTVWAADDQLVQEALKKSLLLQASKVDVTRFQNYSSRTQLKLNLKASAASFASYTSIDRVPATRTVNGYPLSSNVSLSASAVAYAPTGNIAATNVQTAINELDTEKMKTDYSNAGTAPTWNQNTTGSAAKLTTGRTISISGPITYTSPSFDGSGNVTAAATVANQTGTGSKFVMDTSPSLVTPDIGTATGAQITLSGGGSIPLILNTTSGVYGASNWAVSNTVAAYGDLGIMQSSTLGGNPLAGITRLYFTNLNASDLATFSGKLAVTVGGSTNKAICWKVGGVLGYCSTVVASDGSCTCN